uniref:Uncharacterized protein n=1 Tax=Rhizophora mucronata TaxID=61149 RepID=A0A2P2P5U8_RHIMU
MILRDLSFICMTMI